MATQAGTLAGRRPPAIAAALANISRVILLLLVLALLAFVRTGVPIYGYPAVLGACLLSLYLITAGSGGFRLWAVYVAAFIAFAQLRTLADETGMPTQFAYAIDLEKGLFFGTVPTVWLQEQFYSFSEIGILEAYTIPVYLSYFAAPHVVGLLLWRFDRERFEIFVPAFLITIYVGLLVCFLLPTAPPWMAGQTGDLPHVFRVLQDISGEVTPGVYERAYETVGPNDVAAMPSLHAAVPVVIALALWSRPVTRIAGIVYAASMCFALVYLGEHYFVDAAAGAATALVAWAVAVRLVGWLAGRQAQTGRGAPAAAGQGA